MSEYRIVAIDDDLFIDSHVGRIACEWGTYTDGYDCDDEATVCILNVADTSDPSYPEGFHEGHLCDQHIQDAAHLYDNLQSV